MAEAGRPSGHRHAAARSTVKGVASPGLDPGISGEKREPTPLDCHKRRVEIVVPVFEHKDHVGIDREHGFPRP